MGNKPQVNANEFGPQSFSKVSGPDALVQNGFYAKTQDVYGIHFHRLNNDERAFVIEGPTKPEAGVLFFARRHHVTFRVKSVHTIRLAVRWMDSRTDPFYVVVCKIGPARLPVVCEVGPARPPVRQWDEEKDGPTLKKTGSGACYAPDGYHLVKTVDLDGYYSYEDLDDTEFCYKENAWGMVYFNNQVWNDRFPEPGDYYLDGRQLLPIIDCWNSERHNYVGFECEKFPSKIDGPIDLGHEPRPHELLPKGYVMTSCVNHVARFEELDDDEEAFWTECGGGLESMDFIHVGLKKMQIWAIYTISESIFTVVCVPGPVSLEPKPKRRFSLSTKRPKVDPMVETPGLMVDTPKIDPTQPQNE